MEVAHRKKDSSGAFEGAEEGRIRGQLSKIRILKRGKFGEDVEEEIDFDMDTFERDHHLWNKGKKKQHTGKGKEKWEGESFDIGREFIAPKRVISSDPEEMEQDEVEGNAIAGPSTTNKRPGMTARSTQESFVTARTEFTASTAASSRVNLPITNGATDVEDSDDHSMADRVDTRRSGSSSVQPLIGDAPDRPNGTLHDKELAYASLGSSGLKRLKSAIRRPSNAMTTLSGQAASTRGKVPQNRSKSVTFPVDPVNREDEETELELGNKPPANPGEVLARAGEDAEGTSAGAQEAALNDDEWDEDEEIRLGDVILRGAFSAVDGVLMADRMLVKVGYHRDEGLDGFDEAKQVCLQVCIVRGY